MQIISLKKIVFILIFLLIYSAFTPANADFSPFQTRDQNPFNLIQGQPLPVNAAIARKNQLLWTSTLTITNTSNVQQLPDEAIQLDYESYRLNLGLQYGFSNNWAVSMTLPFIYKGGGFLDDSINSWHHFFNQPQGNRPNVANNQYNIQRVQNGVMTTNLQSASSGIGDLQLSLAYLLTTSTTNRISLWTGLKLPTGDSAKLNSNDAIDASIWLALNHQLAQHWFFNTNAGVVLPAIIITGSRNANNSGISDQVLYGHAMLAWQVLDGLDLKLQLAGHTSYYKNSGLLLLGSTYFTTFGGTIHLNRCNNIDIGINEDIKVAASPDVSFLFTWRHQGSCQTDN